MAPPKTWKERIGSTLKVGTEWLPEGQRMTMMSMFLLRGELGFRV